MAAILFGVTAHSPAFISSAPIAPHPRYADPEDMMFICLIEGQRIVAFCALVAGLFAAADASRAAEPFPFNREFLLDGARMPAIKRVPILMVESGSAATIDLWCKTARECAIQWRHNSHRDRTAAGEALPQCMAPGQCTPERMQADLDLVAALSQVREWRHEGGAVVLVGPQTLKFRPSDYLARKKGRPEGRPLVSSACGRITSCRPYRPCRPCRHPASPVPAPSAVRLPWPRWSPKGRRPNRHPATRFEPPWPDR